MHNLMSESFEIPSFLLFCLGILCFGVFFPPGLWSPTPRSPPQAWFHHPEVASPRRSFIFFWEVDCVTRVGHFYPVSEWWWWSVWVVDVILAYVVSGIGGWVGEDDIWWWGDLSQLDIFDHQLSHWQCVCVCVPGLCAHPPWRERPICNPYFRRGCKQRSGGLCAVQVFSFVPSSMEHISTDHPRSLDISRCEIFQRYAKMTAARYTSAFMSGKWREGEPGEEEKDNKDPNRAEFEIKSLCSLNSLPGLDLCGSFRYNMIWNYTTSCCFPSSIIHSFISFIFYSCIFFLNDDFFKDHVTKLSAASSQPSPPPGWSSSPLATTWWYRASGWRTKSHLWEVEFPPEVNLRLWPSSTKVMVLSNALALAGCFSLPPSSWDGPPELRFCPLPSSSRVQTCS